MFNEYPYTDFHELNLDFILKKIKNINTETAELLELINANVETLQGEIDDSNVRIDGLDIRVGDLEALSGLGNKNILCIGDSYLAYSSQEQESESWGAFMRILLGSDNTVTLHGLGGSGFIGNAAKTFDDLLMEAQVDRGKITDIVVLGGLNDASRVADDAAVTWSNVNTAISQFISDAHTNFPNAKVHIGFAGWMAYGFTGRDTYMPYILEGIRTYRNVNFLDRYGIVRYINGIEYIMPVLSTSLYKIDKIHPTATASARIGTALTNYMLTGKATNDIELYSGLNIVASGMAGGISSNSIKLHSDGENIVIDGGAFSIDSPNPASLASNTRFEIGLIPDAPIRACTSRPLIVDCIIAIFPGKNGVYDTANAQLIIENGTVYLYPWYNTVLGNYTNITSISVLVGSHACNVLTSC